MVLTMRGAFLAQCLTRPCGVACQRDLSRRLRRTMCHADNAYHIPHMRVVSHRYRTTPLNTAFRGFGGLGDTGVEQAIDEVAHHLGLDPLIVRRRNFYPHELNYRRRSMASVCWQWQ